MSGSRQGVWQRSDKTKPSLKKRRHNSVRYNLEHEVARRLYEGFGFKNNEHARAAQETDGFTAQQVAALLGNIGFSSDKLAMLVLLAPRIIDLSGQEGVLILGAFSSENDKLGALALIKHTLRQANDLNEVTQVFRFSSNQTQARTLLSSLR
jgi:hypothetical protein